jgi:hypothetical protein
VGWTGRRPRIALQQRGVSRKKSTPAARKVGGGTGRAHRLLSAAEGKTTAGFDQGEKGNSVTAPGEESKPIRFDYGDDLFICSLFSVLHFQVVEGQLQLVHLRPTLRAGCLVLASIASRHRPLQIPAIFALLHANVSAACIRSTQQRLL